MEILAKVHAKNLVKWAQDKPRVLVLSADLTSSTEADLFRDTYPDRFISLGIAEQNMVSFAAGLAREGFIPLIHTFAVFIYRRAYDQVAMSVAYSNLPVKFLGFLPGITTPGGATHQALEDLALMRALPNMTVLECGDATEVESVLDLAYRIAGPVYIRMLRGEVPRLFPASEPMQLATPRILSQGTDILLLSSGICTEEALRATVAIQQRGLAIHHLHIATLKPFASAQILSALRTGGRYGVVTLENHTVVGGLGTAVAEIMAEHGIGKRLHKLGLQDTFSHGASKPYLMSEHGINARALITKIEELCGRRLDIADAELQKVRLEAVHSMAKVEAL